MLSAAELWRSGADDKYQSIAHTLAAANLLHIADAYWYGLTGQTDMDTVPLHRHLLLVAASNNNPKKQ